MQIKAEQVKKINQMRDRIRNDINMLNSHMISATKDDSRKEIERDREGLIGRRQTLEEVMQVLGIL